MNILHIPKKYERTLASKARYIEGWRDAQANRPHAFPAGKAAEDFKRRYGKAQLDAYGDGFLAGSTRDD